MSLKENFQSVSKWHGRAMDVAMPAMAIAMAGPDPLGWIFGYFEHCYGGYGHIGEAVANIGGAMGIESTFNAAAVGAAGTVGYLAMNKGEGEVGLWHAHHIFMTISMAIMAIALGGIDPTMWIMSFFQHAYGGLMHLDDALANIDDGLGLGLGIEGSPDGGGMEGHDHHHHEQESVSEKNTAEKPPVAQSGVSQPQSPAEPGRASQQDSHSVQHEFKSRSEWFAGQTDDYRAKIEKGARGLGISVAEYTKGMCATPGLEW